LGGEIEWATSKEKKKNFKVDMQGFNEPVRWEEKDRTAKRKKTRTNVGDLRAAR